MSSPPSSDPNSDDRRTWIKSMALFSEIVADLLVSTGLGVGAGYWAWKHWGAPWWVILLTSFIGLGVAFYRLYQVSQAENQDISKSDQDKTNDAR